MSKEFFVTWLKLDCIVFALTGLVSFAASREAFKCAPDSSDVDLNRGLVLYRFNRVLSVSSSRKYHSQPGLSGAVCCSPAGFIEN